MTQLILKIQDGKLPFFLELIKNFDFIEVQQGNIPELHKKIVRNRIKNTRPEDYTEWDVLEKKMKLD